MSEHGRAVREQLLKVVPRLRAFAISLTYDPDRADDLVQDTLLRALSNLDRFDPDTNLQAWMFTILRNEFHTHHRKRRREVEDVDGFFAAQLTTPPEQPGNVEFAELRLALARLSPQHREVLLLVGAEGFSYEEAAEICSTKVGTIKSRVNRARMKLAELLGYSAIEDVGPDPAIQAAMMAQANVSLQGPVVAV
jgi:RNA polymerase sigma-70 factor (ECF subfamily)